MSMPAKRCVEYGSISPVSACIDALPDVLYMSCISANNQRSYYFVYGGYDSGGVVMIVSGSNPIQAGLVG